jgi:hypothetical protein
MMRLYLIIVQMSCDKCGNRSMRGGTDCNCCGIWRKSPAAKWVRCMKPGVSRPCPPAPLAISNGPGRPNVLSAAPINMSGKMTSSLVLQGRAGAARGWRRVDWNRWTESKKTAQWRRDHGCAVASGYDYQSQCPPGPLDSQCSLPGGVPPPCPPSVLPFPPGRAPTVLGGAQGPTGGAPCPVPIDAVGAGGPTGPCRCTIDASAGIINVYGETPYNEVWTGPSKGENCCSGYTRSRKPFPQSMRGRWNWGLTNTKMYPIISECKVNPRCPPCPQGSAGTVFQTFIPKSSANRVAYRVHSGNLFPNTAPMTKKQLFSYLSRNRKYLNR